MQTYLIVGCGPIRALARSLAALSIDTLIIDPPTPEITFEHHDLSTLCIANSGYDYYRHENSYPGQGNDGWRNFKRFLRTVRLIAVQPLKVKVLSIAEFSSRFRFHLRSHPRWRSLRWKAKT